MDTRARRFVQEIDGARKPIAVISHGAWLLVSAGLVAGRTLTSNYTHQDDIRSAGGNWVDQEVTVDATWVSSRRPADIPAFNREVIRVFAKQPASRRR
jgi:protease I